MHGCTGKGNDQLRFELSFKATDPELRVIAPLRDRIWTRDEEIEYALAKGIPVQATQASPFSIDENLFGRAIEAGVLEDPWAAPPEEPYALTGDPAAAPAPVEVTIEFEQGVPVALDGEELALAELVAKLNALAGPYGIGRIDMIENRAVGIKSREVYEAPAAIVLIQAHSALEDVVLTKDEARIKRGLEQRWTELVYEGLWFSPAREAIDAFVDKTQELVDGEVRVELRPNAAVVTGRRSPHMLYAEQLASYGTGRDLPARRGRGLHQDLLPGGRAGSRPRAGEDQGMTLWAGRVGRELDPAVAAFLRGDDAELLPYDCEATAIHARRLHAAGILDDAELAEAESRLAEIARAAEPLAPEDEDVHSRDRAPARRGRPEDPRRPLPQRPGRRRVPALRRRRLRRGARGDRGLRRRRARPRRGGRRDADAGLHAPPARPARDRRPPPARLGGDARARPRPLRRRRWRSEREPARRRRAGRLDAAAAAAGAAAAQLARRGRGPGLRARLPLRRRRSASSTSRGSARSSSSGRPPSSASRRSARTPRPARR